ncbi:MAG: aminomethyl-transferring glycine dehydrogenase subunit GcvPA [Cyanobacteria bacterium SIG31]|nr:aminomethyl-transferring glycine dehydrogenase subunit GcvPA [Cyanobacteria bacterium SIG31]
MKNFIAHTDKRRQELLGEISCNSIDDLFKQIPVLFNKFNIGDALSELETQKKVKTLAKRNATEFSSFLGGGVYNKFIPACVNYIAQRFEFLTAYTPYQPEISQGTLQIIYEYQTMISKITGMDIANASMYDAGSACAEAILMSHRISRGKKNKALVSERLNPEYKEVIKTYCWAQGVDIVWFDELPATCEEYCCVLIQNPDYYGEINEIKKLDTILVVVANLSALSILEPPTEADIVVGDIQPLGISMSFGGPHAGFMACKEAYMRQLPGRLVGRTLDADGEIAYTLTIQTREQHIKREKATSNICSNQSLIALSATLYLSLLGEKGFRQTGVISAKLAHLLSNKLATIGIKTLNKNFFNEFTIEVKNTDDVLSKLKKASILGGIKLDENHILVATTEMNTEEEINEYINAIK